MLSLIEKIIEREREKVLDCNKKNYDMVCESYMRAFQHRISETDILQKRLTERIRDFQSKNLSMIPPLLCRMNGEPLESFLDRVYYAGGYKNGKDDNNAKKIRKIFDTE
jgi:vacuolar-type H+-ATPase subunit C/Vma6